MNRRAHWGWPLALLVLAGCQQDMATQPRYDPLEASPLFEDGRSARPQIPGTVARGHLEEDEHRYTGKSGGTVVDTFPYPVTKRMLDRGQERFDIYCAPCHGRIGDGRGMIVQRGLSAPPSLHIERLRSAPVGHIFQVISKGLGRMYDYADRISVDDRWAVIAYIRALQLSQNARLEDVPEPERQNLSRQTP
jgi:hypothetical protein